MKTATINKSLLAATFALSGLLFSSPATFAAGEERSEAQFSALDANQDGQLSPEEASADTNLSNKWTEADKDQSGTVDPAEFSAFEAIEPQSEQSNY